MGVGSEIYSGAANFGKMWAMISAIFVSIASIGMIIGGIYILYHNSHLRQVQGTITKSSYNCVKHSDKHGESTICHVNVEYTVANKKYNKIFSNSDMYTKGNTITVYYNPTDPSESEINPIPKWLGWALIIGAVFMVGASWIWLWLVNRYKFLAAAEGTREVFRMF